MLEISFLQAVILFAILLAACRLVWARGKSYGAAEAIRKLVEHWE